MLRVAARAWQVGRSAARHHLVPWLLRRSEPPRARRAQAMLEDLGGLWIKLGQALALRFDILPEDYCLQLFQLLNRVEPFPAEEVRAVLEQDLARPVESVFRDFDWRPHAAASIGQVHLAELPDGTRVAVKVQRPRIRELVGADLRIMRWLAAFVDATGIAGGRQAGALIRELARWTEEELDYRIEARHAAMLRRNADGDPLERNPVVFAEYTSARILTLEYLDGIPVLDIMTATRRNDTAFLDALAARGHDRKRIAAHIVWNALNQIYRFGTFHADPHPANVLVLPGDAVGYVDFGIVGKLDDETTQSLRYFAQSLFAGATGTAVDELMRFLTPSARTDVAAARRDLIEAMNDYVESARVGPDGASLGESLFEIEMLAVVRAHRMTLRPDAVRYLKAVLTAEAMVKELDPQFDLRACENRFFGRLMELEAIEALDPRRLAQRVLDARMRVGRLLEAVEGLVDTPRDLLGVALTVRRRVQALAAVMALGWAAVLATVSLAPGWPALQSLGRPLVVIGIVGALASVGLLVFSVLEVRRLPSEADVGRRSPFPRRAR